MFLSFIFILNLIFLFQSLLISLMVESSDTHENQLDLSKLTLEDTTGINLTPDYIEELKQAYAEIAEGDDTLTDIECIMGLFMSQGVDMEKEEAE